MDYLTAFLMLSAVYIVGSVIIALVTQFLEHRRRMALIKELASIRAAREQEEQ